ncbi:sialate O-acetylesterase [Mucilaginibacter sp. UR6-11]|uniref:sialate O-acetylesterase n=1 Tax=Mucilaginibacter sp. UR6-11 TaxID=1435644 RepID=UPI001E5F0B87|nr:sialate O-acetylesterase [Mucilaginibacter sp. UR6-11]MCC8426525.1 sialate O-acetylesterase [Mucilaginibacter sp. UR6-11]
MKKSIAVIFKTTLVILLSCNATFAQFRLPAIFGDNMVLQRNMNVPVYGWGEVGEQVQVDFKGKTYTTTTGADGKWLVKLNSYKAGGPYEMHISGKSTSLTYKNILIGDVWLASGQSNMEFGIQTEKHAADAIPKATDGLIRLFYVPMALSLQPLYDIPRQSPGSPNGKWVVCSPEVLADRGFVWHGFSAVGLYFAQQIRKSTGAPVGVIGSYRGGTPAQSWITAEGLKQSPAFTKYVDAHKKLVDNFETATAIYPERLEFYRNQLKIWNTEVGTPFNDTLKKWNADVAQAKAERKPAPPRPKPSRPAPVPPADPLGGYQSPTICFNGVIAPLVGYGIKGVIWYQGESNGDYFDDAIEYKDLFPRMATDWRRVWGQGDFAFLFMQLPNFRQPAVTPSENNWPWVREAQTKTLALANTGMTNIIDAGDQFDIHPINKLVPGNRLALVARHNIYGEKVVATGPVYKSMKINGNQIIISFAEIHKGLVTAGLVGDDVVNTDGAELKGFGIAGADHKFVWARAVIKGKTVVVTSDEVVNPQAVRYNWADNPPGNLYNKDGLPANPFRTDDWPPLKN